jgi:hypothetical protein
MVLRQNQEDPVQPISFPANHAPAHNFVFILPQLLRHPRMLLAGTQRLLHDLILNTELTYKYFLCVYPLKWPQWNSIYRRQ